jgi:hypothetical protein
METYKTEDSCKATGSYRLIGEKQGVSASEWAELGDVFEDHIIMAQSKEELTDECVVILPLKFAYNARELISQS